MKKNETCVIRITDISHDGSGIGKIEQGEHAGFTLFVKDTVPGDLVEVLVMKAKKHYGFGRVQKVLEASKDRVEPSCPIARPCGGCQLQVLSYEKQLQWKADQVRNDLIRIGGLEADEAEKILLPAVASPKQFRYRNKAQFPIGKNKEGEIVAGFYAGRTHRIIPCKDCLLGAEENQDILDLILAWMREEAIAPYDEQTGKGLVRHVLIRKGMATGDLIVCIIINGKKLPADKKLIQKLQTISGIVGITVSSNTEKTNVIMNQPAAAIWGQDYMTDILRSEKYGIEVKYRISPQSFYQVNHDQTEQLYEKVLDLAQLTGDETVMDLYCGIGTISLFLAKHAQHVIGVEIVPQAIIDAKKNAELNEISNAEFYTGKAEEIVPELYRRGRTADVVVVDPPRKGCDEKLLETIIAIAPEKLVYVSCDPATLARDIKILRENGFELKSAQSYDQFAQTTHVETVVLLSREKVDGYVDIDLEI